MYVKRHAVVRGRTRYVYLRLVQAYRDEHGRVRHRVLKTLGREDELKASGQLEQLMGSFARLDPPMTGVRREVGPLLLAWHFIAELDLIGTVDRALPQRGRQQLSVGEAVAALICSRLCSPSPLYDIAGWASGAALQELLGIPAVLLNDDRLGRALEILAMYAETLRGTLAARAIERFGIDAGRLHVDLTALRVCGAYENSALVANGWAQGQGVGRQVRALQAATADGVSLYVRPEPGNAAEVSLIAQSLERLRQLSGPGGLLILDSACGHPKTLCEIARAGLSFIVPLRAQTGFRERFLTDVGPDSLRAVRYVSQREHKLPSELRTKYRGALRDWELTDPETGETRRLRVAYIHSPEEHRETAAARERALTKAEEQLQRVKNGLGGRYYKTRKQVETRVARIIAPNIEGLITTTTSTRNGKPTLTWTRDQEAINTAAQTDGIYALATNLPQQTADRRADPARLQRAADRRAPPPRLQTITQSPADLPAQRRPHLRAHQHHRNRAPDLRTDRNRDTQRARRYRAAPRPAAREPLSETHRTQRARRLPRTRPHLHTRRHRTRPPHPDSTPCPRATPDHTTLARATASTANPFLARKMGLAL